MRPVLVKDFSPLVIQASHWTRSATLNARFTLMSSGSKYFGPSAFLPSESCCCLFALSQFLTLLFTKSYIRLINAKLPCSSHFLFQQPDRSPSTWKLHHMHFSVSLPWWGWQNYYRNQNDGKFERARFTSHYVAVLSFLAAWILWKREKSIN